MVVSDCEMGVSDGEMADSERKRERTREREREREKRAHVLKIYFFLLTDNFFYRWIICC